jgi:hypothetical protein
LIRALLMALALWFVPGTAWAQAAPPSPRERCEALAGGRFQKLEGAPTYIVSAKLRPANGTQPEACLVEGYVNPTVNFAILLPSTTWNGRFMVRGCGGSCGSVVVDLACARHVRDGFACLHTDMGHRSTLIDNNWVPNNLQGLVDFGYRATHVGQIVLLRVLDGRASGSDRSAAVPRRFRRDHRDGSGEHGPVRQPEASQHFRR